MLKPPAVGLFADAPPHPADRSPARRRVDEPEPAGPTTLAGPPPTVVVPTEHAKRDALAAFRAIGESAMPRRLLRLLARAARGEIRDKRGRRWTGLTDYEAAAILNCERTTVNAARSPLMRAGLVTSEGKRTCRHRPSRFAVNAWTATREGQAEAAR